MLPWLHLTFHGVIKPRGVSASILQRADSCIAASAAATISTRYYSRAVRTLEKKCRCVLRQSGWGQGDQQTKN